MSESKPCIAVDIAPYASSHAEQVNRLVLSIQQEFQVPITLEQQPDLQDVESFFRRGEGNFWVALAAGRVVGTIGLLDIGNRQYALRKMFVHPEFRGKEKGVAAALLQAAIDWSQSKNYDEVFLGTTDKYVAAHRFYEKSGFRRIDPAELPVSFPRMEVDSVFFARQIRGSE